MAAVITAGADKTRTQVALIIESGEPREVMHFALLIGYGASAINPYLPSRRFTTCLARLLPDKITGEYAEKISSSYQQRVAQDLLQDGHQHSAKLPRAQVFEPWAEQSLIDAYFSGTASRIEGVGLEVLAREAQLKHAYAFQPFSDLKPIWWSAAIINIARAGVSLLNPLTIGKLQQSVRQNIHYFQEYTDLLDDRAVTYALCAACSSLNILTSHCRSRKSSLPRKSSTIHDRRNELRLISKEAHETLALP